MTNPRGRPRMARLRMAATLAPAVLAAGGIDLAFATTDTTFDAPLDTVTDMVSSTGGQLAAALAVGAALVGSVRRVAARLPGPKRAVATSRQRSLPGRGVAKAVPPLSEGRPARDARRW